MTFSHPPLKRRQIRLLQVLPHSQTTHLVSCQLRPFFLGSPQLPTFTAVSYTWGDPTPKKDILINGASFKTTDSAYSLLLHGGTGAYLWIDALCIDQSNNDEKATQVLLMGEIYTAAGAVDIWLGPESEDSTTAVNFIFQLKVDLAKLSKPGQVYNNTSTHRREWIALSKLCRRPWFSRLWVLQEVVLASNVVRFACGQQTFAWSDMWDVIQHLDRLEAIPALNGQPNGAADPMNMQIITPAVQMMRTAMALHMKRQ